MIISKKNRHCTCRSCFTLVEALATVAIILLVSGFTVMVLVKPPMFVSLAAEAEQYATVLTAAAYQSIVTGREVAVNLKRDAARNTLAANALLADSDGNPLMHTSYVCRDVEVEFISDEPGDEAILYFFPDGSASGPALIFKRGDMAVKVGVSKLTGMVKLEEINR